MSRKRTLAWRVQSNDEGGFDELVLGSDPYPLLHVEMLTRSEVHVSIGGADFWAHVDKNGRVKITDVEGLDEEEVK